MSTPKISRPPARSNRGTRRVLFGLALPALVTLGAWLALAPAPTRASSVRLRIAKPEQEHLAQPPRAAPRPRAAPPLQPQLRAEAPKAEPEPPPDELDPLDEGGEGEDEPRERPRVETFEQIRARQAREQASVHERLERRFSRQGVDPAWRRHAESQLSDGVQSIAGLDLQLESSSCREDVCMTLIKHEGTEVDAERLTKFIFATARGLEHHFKYEPGRMTVYSMRRDPE